MSFPAPPPPAPARARSIVLPCVLLFGAMFNLTLVVAGLKEFIIEDLGGTVADATLFFSVETLAYILFAPIWGLVSDRLGRRKPLIVAGFLASAALYAAYIFVDSVPLLLVLRFHQGAFSVMGWSLVMALVMDQPLGQRGRTMGLLGAALIFGVALGAPMGGYLTRWFGARAPVGAAALLFALLALTALLLREGPKLRSAVRLRQILGAMKRRPRLLVPMGFHFVDRLAVGLFVVVFPLYLDSMGAADAAVRGRYLSFFLIPFAFLQYFTGRLVEKIGPYRPLVLGSLLYGLLLAMVGFAGLDLLWPVMVGLGVLASIMFPPALLLTSRLSDSRIRASAVGGFNLAGSLGFALGPVIGAWAYMAKGFGFAFALCGSFEIVIAVIGWAVLRRWRGAQPEAPALAPPLRPAEAPASQAEPAAPPPARVLR